MSFSSPRVTEEKTRHFVMDIGHSILRLTVYRVTKNKKNEKISQNYPFGTKFT